MIVIWSDLIWFDYLQLATYFIELMQVIVLVDSLCDKIEFDFQIKLEKIMSPIYQLIQRYEAIYLNISRKTL
jgi:hypothetical protein